MCVRIYAYLYCRGNDYNVMLWVCSILTTDTNSHTQTHTQHTHHTHPALLPSLPYTRAQLKETKCLKEELLIKEMKFKKVVGKKEKTVKHIQEIFWMQRRRTTDEVAAFEGSKSQEIECLQMQQLDEKRKKYLQEISSLGYTLTHRSPRTNTPTCTTNAQTHTNTN